MVVAILDIVIPALNKSKTLTNNSSSVISSAEGGFRQPKLQQQHLPPTPASHLDKDTNEPECLQKLLKKSKEAHDNDEEKLLFPNSIKTWDDWLEEARGVIQSKRCFDSITQQKSTSNTNVSNSSRCECKDPFTSIQRESSPRWDAAFQTNQQMAHGMKNNDHLEMVMLGDSIMEFWNGKYLNEPLGMLKENPLIFEKIFSDRAIAIGISSDISVELAFRLMNGEMPASLNPKLWWILIGTNDYGRTGCNYQMVTAGIIHVVQTVRMRRPNATVIVNALLPRGKEAFFENHAWQELSKVNEYLACYVSDQNNNKNNKNIQFVNDTALFLSNDNKLNNQQQQHVNRTLMNGFLHPSSIGYQLWGEHIVKTVSDIEKQMGL
eukprot:CAMPEP_0198138808 /NCGR_PEP_ID=MMETSP1443-20131203/2200_1 /TAXON_ID=186043 /ORGANISM="Entomoneis sp., Strain CCMP2396" /LENGTH=378 /DNA_ID=CAMNT_0043800745 /DNA_START=141 /DNA_END=1277 /DNA_ORIENTATION=+